MIVKAGARVFGLWKDYGLLVSKPAEDMRELHIEMLSPDVVILFMTNRVAIEVVLGTSILSRLRLRGVGSSAKT